MSLHLKAALDDILSFFEGTPPAATPISELPTPAVTADHPAVKATIDNLVKPTLLGLVAAGFNTILPGDPAFDSAMVQVVTNLANGLENSVLPQAPETPAS